MRYRLPSVSETRSLEIVRTLLDAMQGRSLAIGSVTLTAGATTTTVIAPWLSSYDTVVMMPATANAAAAVATTYIKESDITKGQFVITHANNAQTDRTFRWHSAGG